MATYHSAVFFKLWIPSTPESIRLVPNRHEDVSLGCSTKSVRKGLTLACRPGNNHSWSVYSKQLSVQSTHRLDHPWPMMAHEQRNIRQHPVRHLSHKSKNHRHQILPNLYKNARDVRNSPLRRDLTKRVVILVSLTLGFGVQIEFHRGSPLDGEELDAA